MVSSQPPFSAYEESPEQLKDLIKNGTGAQGMRPPKVSKSRLLKSHEANLKLLSTGQLSIRNFILPLPYPPSRSSPESAEKLRIADLRVEERDQHTVLIVKTITSPYIYSATVTVVEDEYGDVAQLTVSNLEDNAVDPIIPEGTILAIKQPSWSRLLDGGVHIRVDHPSDLTFPRSMDDIVPNQWRQMKAIDLGKDATKWKKEGDMMFLKKRFRKALELYDRGLDSLASAPDPVSSIDLYRKKCGVNIVLLRLDDAAQDLSLAIALHATSTFPSSPMSEPAVVNSWLHNAGTQDPLKISSNIPRPLKELAARIKFDLGIYQSTADYDLSLMSSYVGPLTLHIDAANYTAGAEVRHTASHGRGLFAKRDFKAGELLSVEKAFVLPGYFIQDRSSDCLLYSLGDETASPRPGALLFRELVQKLMWNPSLRKEFFDLDDGGYWKKHGWELEEGEEVPVDIFRIEKIRQLNCFSVPTRSVDLLSLPPNANPELRNGFWNHASYVNHSCLPNSIRTFIGDIHFLRATRDIAAGEELTHQYVSPEVDIEERQQKFRGTWGFECDCHLCEVDGKVSQERRQERLKRFEELKSIVMKLGDKGPTTTSLKKIARGLRELEALYVSTDGEVDSYAQLPRLALVHPSLFLTEAWRGINNTDKMIESAKMLLRNFGLIPQIEGDKFDVVTSAGLINVETVRALRYLHEGYTTKGETKLAEQCMSTARSWYPIITGSEVGIDEFFKS